MEKIVTSNPNKAKISGIEFNEPPLFNEEEIKSRVPKDVLGFRYPLLISAEKAIQQRELTIKEKGESDDVIVVSDSVVLLGDLDIGIVINRDSKEELERANEVIKENKDLDIYFCGSASFTRLRERHPIYQIVTFFRFKNERNLQFPVKIEDLASKDHEFGIINSLGEIINLGRNDFKNGRSYISGLTPEFVNLAKEYSSLEDAEKALRDQIARYPFNTLIFYDLVKRDYTYHRIVNEWREIFEKNGGNCSFHTLFLADNLSRLGFNPEIVIFNSKNPDHDRGHSAVKIGNFLFDPGLSIPFPIPITPIIQPVHSLSGKKIYFLEESNSYDNGCIIMEKDQSRRIIFKIQEIISMNDFLRRLPKVLEELHNRRNKAKIDRHDEDGILIERLIEEI